MTSTFINWTMDKEQYRQKVEEFLLRRIIKEQRKRNEANAKNQVKKHSSKDSGKDPKDV